MAIFSPLREAVSDQGKFQTLFARLGWTVDQIPNQYLTLGQDVVSAILLLDQLADDVSLDEVKGIFDTIVSLNNTLQSLPPPPGVGVGAGELAESLIELLLGDHLAKEAPHVFRLLMSLGVITSEYSAATDQRPAFIRRNLQWSQLPKILGNPALIGNVVYGWGESDFEFLTLAEDVLEVLSALELRAELREIGTPAQRAAFLDDTTITGTDTDAAVDVIFMDGVVDGVPVAFGLTLAPLPAEGTSAPGLVVQPLVPSTAHDSIDLGNGLSLILEGKTNFDSAFGLVVRPGQKPSIREPFSGSSVALTGDAKLKLQATFTPPVVLLGSPSASRIEVGGLLAAIEFHASTGGSPELRFELSVQNVKLVVKGGDGDGFIDQALSGQDIEVPLDFGLRWSSLTGIGFSGSGGFEISFPGNVAFGPVTVGALDLAIRGKPGTSGAGELALELGAGVGVTLGPLTVTMDGVGVHLDVAFESGNAGPFNLAAGFKSPTGLGISVDAGSVHGGGFISFDEPNSRYVGALQLSVYDIAVSAFGLLETKLPTGSGYSFVIIISAQFTPIQLGFGFTLNGVGGMVGINRAIDTTALATLVRAGQSEELLFPKNVVADAPTIVRDLTSVFPGTQGHYVFGPLGKLGWGTPTLITGEIGVILEIPGPVVVLLGEVKCLLPKPDAALVKLNLSVDGELDFPNKLFSMDASLHDSVINGFPVSGQMAMRVGWGDQPNFVFSIGGFHPAYTPPPNFPKLQPMTLDLGSHGPAKISVSGFFAVTSNTVQVGGSASLHAGGSGITLDASVSVKALFVFQPFSFEADIDASVKISFHGYGPSVHLSGTLDGPSPWHIKGEVCVSIIWWDACLGFDVTFGGDTQVTQPSLDPWEDDTAVPGTPPAILRLKDAFSDPGNWSGAQIPGTVSSVTRAQGTDTLVDPAGGLTVRQKVAPVETANPLTKFGVAKTPAPVTFSGVQATLGTGNQTVSLTAVQAVNEPFAPAQFFDMDDGKKLSSAGYEQYQAGYLFATADGKNAQGGSTVTFTPQLQTFVINSDGSDTLITGPAYKPTDTKVAAFNKRSAVAKGGLTLAGTRRFVNRAFTPSFTERLPTFVIGDSTTLAVPTVAPPAPAVRSATLIALDVYRAQHVELAPNVQVTALYDMPNPPTA